MKQKMQSIEKHTSARRIYASNMCKLKLCTKKHIYFWCILWQKINEQVLQFFLLVSMLIIRNSLYSLRDFQVLQLFPHFMRRHVW